MPPLLRLLGVALAVLFLAALAALIAVLSLVLPQLPELVAGLLKPGWTILALAVPALLCVLVVLVCTGRLLVLVGRERIFRAEAMPWVNAIVWAMGAGWVTLLAAGVPVFVIAELDDAPGLAGLHLLILLAGGAVLLLVVVMRTLLRRATALQSDMEVVI